MQNKMTERNEYTPQFERVQKMQMILNEMNETIENFETTLNKLESKQGTLQELSRYYGDEKWHEDRQTFNDGKFPEGYDYSVLGEDPVFDVLMDHHELSIRMLEIATAMIKLF